MDIYFPRNRCTNSCKTQLFYSLQVSEMTKITNSNQSHNSYRKYKSENGRTRTSEYITGGIRCHGGVSIRFYVVVFCLPHFILEDSTHFLKIMNTKSFLDNCCHDKNKKNGFSLFSLFKNIECLML
jgi:hypothetical protein